MPMAHLPPYRPNPVGWTAAVQIPIPGSNGHRVLHLPCPNVTGFHHSTKTRYGKRRGCVLVAVMYWVIFFAIYTCWQAVMRDVPTLVFRRQDLRRVLQWEIASGHYPSGNPLPQELDIDMRNPAIPPFGPKRVYVNVESAPPHVAYAPRPLPGSVADLDLIFAHCDVDLDMYARDCLEVMRVGAGLDRENRVQRPVPREWRYIFMQDTPVQAQTSLPSLDASEIEFERSPIAEWDYSPVSLPPIPTPHPVSFPCNPDDPRIFHMYWTGDFTDKPYLSILSFLFTQNLGLHFPDYQEERTFCRPQLWMWINPFPASQVPHATAEKELIENLRLNPWSTPFFHQRFKRIVHFKFWNTTEQLDGIPVLKDDWRNVKTLFKSYGRSIDRPEHITSPKKGSKDYDHLSVIMSDMARFVLCHRFGGIYLDADMLFLRDWEELWGWQGNFAYRWSTHKRYNTAVLRLRKNSALGVFLLRTALKNDLDFHPITVNRYLKEAHLDGLLSRIPDALFDPAWLNADGYQRDRPPQPYFKSFADFFDVPSPVGASPQALGFDGFFKGAFTYHFHNSWWKLIDPGQNYPNLGAEFPPAERPMRYPRTPRDLSWSTVLKRTFEAYLRGERPNMYGEWILY